MGDFWVKFGFFVFVLAPIWGALLNFVSYAYVKNDRLKMVLMTLFTFVAIQTLAADFVFLFAGVMGTMDVFLKMWHFFWQGPGVWWWVWSASGYVIATLVMLFAEANQEYYIKECYTFTVISGVVFFVVLFLIYVANAIATTPMVLP